MHGTHSSVSDFVTPAVFFLAFVVIGLVVEYRRKRSPRDFAMVALIGVPGVYLGAIAGPLDLPILLLPAMILCMASIGYQVYRFKRGMPRNEQAGKENE